MAESEPVANDISRVIQSAIGADEVLIEGRYVFVRFHDDNRFTRCELSPDEELKILSAVEKFRETGELPPGFKVTLKATTTGE